MSLTTFWKNRRMIQALRDHKFRVAIFLIKKGADVNKADPDSGWTALTYAAVNGDLNAVKSLLELRADPNKADNREMTPIMRAVEFRHINVFDVLLAQKNVDLNRYDENGWNVLTWGLRCMEEHVVSSLLKDERLDMNPPASKSALSFAYQFQKDYPNKGAYNALIKEIYAAKKERSQPRKVNAQGLSALPVSHKENFIGA